MKLLNLVKEESQVNVVNFCFNLLIVEGDEISFELQKDFAGLEAAGSVLQECGKKQLATDRGELIHD